MNYTFNATVCGHHDGDTIQLLIDLGFDQFTKQWIRMAGDFAPETSEADGKKFADILANRLPIGTPVVVTTEKFKRSFTRYVGTIVHAGQNVNEWMAQQIGTPKGIGSDKATGHN